MFYIIIIILMSYRQHGYPWPSLATSRYRSSPLAGLQGYIPYPHRAAVYMFELVVLLLLGHMWGPYGYLYINTVIFSNIFSCGNKRGIMKYEYKIDMKYEFYKKGSQ